MNVLDEMNVLDASARTDEGAAGMTLVDRRRLRRRRQCIAACFLVPLAVLIGVSVFERLSPDERRFEGVVMQNMGFLRPYEPGTVYHVPLSHGPLPDVVLHQAEPQFVEGSAWVSVQMSMCEARGPHGISSLDELVEECREVVRLDNSTMADGLDLGEVGHDNVLLLSLVPLAPGPIEVSAVELEYSDGDGRRTETYPVDIWIDPDRPLGGP